MKPVSGKRMCQILGSRGWRLARISGSHHIYRHPDSGRRTSVPVHGNADLKPRTQRSIMRDAGLTDADLLTAGGNPRSRAPTAWCRLGVQDRLFLEIRHGKPREALATHLYPG